MQKPRMLGKVAGKLWDKVVPNLVAQGVANDSHQEALIGLCIWWEKFILAREYLDSCGDMGSIQYKRGIECLRLAWKEHFLTAKQFGLTPASQAALGSGAIDDLAEQEYGI